MSVPSPRPGSRLLRSLRPGVPGARLWVRGALRRPGRGLLVTLALLGMTVATVAALVGGSALETLFAADARAQWGQVDVVTFRPGEPFIGEGLARFAGTEAGAAPDAWAGRMVLDAVAATGPANREPDVTLLGVSADELSYASELTGVGQVDPLLLGPEAVLLNRRLADRLDAHVGEPVDLVIAVPEHTDPDDEDVTHDPRVVRWRPTVEGIAEDTGLADFGRTANVITRLDTLQRITDLGGLVSALYVSAPEPGREAAEAVTEAFESVNRMVGLVSVEAQEDALDIAEEEGGLFSGILLTLALLVVAGAALVTANLVILLGQERAREIAVLRALGYRRRTITRLFVAEAGLYALAAAVLGTVLALPLASLLAGAIADNVAGIEAGRGRELVDLDVQADPAAIATGVVVVLLVAGLTIRAAARRVAALPVGEVLRGAPPVLPPPDGRARRVALVQGAGLVLLGMGLTAPAGADLLLFCGVALLAITWWLRRRNRTPAGPDRVVVDERAALAGLVFSIAAPAVFGDFSRGVQSSFGILTLAGVGAVGCATVLATARMPGIMRVVRLYLPGRRRQAPLRTAGSYAGHLRSRAGTVTGTVATVLFMVAALAVLGSATDIGTARQRGGYDVVGTAAVSVDLDQLRSVRGALRVDGMNHTLMGESWFSTVDAEDDDEESSVPYPVRAIRVEAAFTSAQRFTLADALPQYDSAQAALDDALRGEGVVVDRYARPEGADPGDDVVIDDGRGPATFELLAVLDTYVLQGVMIGPDDYDDLFASRGPTMVLAAATEGHDPAALAGEMAEAAADRGLSARPVSEAAAEVVAVNRTFTDVFAIMLRLGLGIALVAVAVLVARAVRERRQQLGVLRAIGFTRRDVVLLLLAEPLLQAATGVVIGLGVGLGVLYLLFARGFDDLAFVVPWRDLAVTSLGVLVLVGLTSLGPALVGSRRPVGPSLRDLG